MALVALSLSSLKRGRAHEVLTAANKLSLNRYWVSSSFIVIAVLLFIALILNLIIAPESLHQILGWVGQALLELFVVVIKIVSLILYPVLLLLSRILTPVLRRIFTQLEGFNAEEIQALIQPEEIPEQVEPLIQRLPEEAQWAFAIVAVLIVGLIFALVLRRLRDEGNLDIRETRESIFSLALLREQLAQLLPYWFTPTAPLAFWALSGEGDSRLAIRKFYQNLLTLAQAQGWPRAKQQTPLEYGRSLHQPFTEQAEAINTLTTHYHHARYAADPPTANQVQASEAAWQELQQKQSPGGSAQNDGSRVEPPGDN
jgi:hypothetical protein